jgi:ubiquinone/menaquinone biosynthesis C-methylase UbiE
VTPPAPVTVVIRRLLDADDRQRGRSRSVYLCARRAARPCLGSMGSFGGETAENYARYRRRYPDAIVDAIADLLRLDSGDVVIDLGCGTGLLTRPFARRVGMVLGVDPEADMLAVARRTTDEEVSPKLVWVLGSDADLPTIGKLVGDQAVGAVTVGQALHFMDYEKLFCHARPLLRVGGGIAVIANGTPLWQQASEWSRALRRALEEWFDTPMTAMCGTDRETQVRYAQALAATGYEVREVSQVNQDELSLEQVLGGVYSALSPDDLPAGSHEAFAEHVAGSLPTTTAFTEVVPVTALVGIAR